MKGIALQRHIRLDGTTFFAEWRGTIFMYESQACPLGIVRDVGERSNSWIGVLKTVPIYVVVTFMHWIKANY